MEIIMLRVIVIVAIILALLTLAYVGRRIRDRMVYHQMTASLTQTDAQLTPFVFKDSGDYDRTAAALLAQARFHKYGLENVRRAGKSVMASRPMVDAFLATVEGFLEGRDVLTGKRGVILKGYVSETDESLQPYSVYVPKAYDGKRPLPLVVDLHGHRWFKPFQCHPARALSGAIVLSPEGRGATDFMWIGEEDVLRAIQEVKRDYVIDSRRVFVTGTSMGGTGAWHLAVRYPHLFAGVGPRAGNCDFRAWETRWGWNRRLEGHHSELRDYLRASSSPVTYMSNLAHTPVYVVHSSADAVVPVEHARAAVAGLRAVGAPVEYREFLVGKHAKFPKHVFDEQLAWLAGRARPSAPAEYSFETRDVRHGRSFYATVLQMKEVMQPARLDVKHEGYRLDIRTTNVLALSVHPADVPASDEDGDDEMTFRLDGNDLRAEVGRAGGPLYFQRSPDGAWRQLDRWPDDDSLRKVKGQEGPVQDVFLAPFTVVVGGRDRTWFKAAEVEAWRFVGEWFRRFGTKPRIVSEGRVTKEMLASRNIVFFGRPARKKLMEKALAQMPVTVTDDGISVGTERFTGKDVGTIFCYPTPNVSGRMIAVFSAVSPEALYQVYTRFGNWFNWGVHDQRKWFDYCVFDRTTANPETYPLVGFFGTDWSLARGRNWKPTKPAKERVRPQHFPPYVIVPDVEAIYLSDVRPASIGHMRGAVGFDRSFRGNPITVQGKVYERGFGMRCPGRIGFSLDGKFSRLTAVVGFTDEPEETVSRMRLRREKLRFVVSGDGRVLHREDVTWLKPAAAIDVDVTGVKKLELHVQALGGALWIHGSSAWADARVER